MAGGSSPAEKERVQRRREQENKHNKPDVDLFELHSKRKKRVAEEFRTQKKLREEAELQMQKVPFIRGKLLEAFRKIGAAEKIERKEWYSKYAPYIKQGEKAGWIQDGTKNKLELLNKGLFDLREMRITEYKSRFLPLIKAAEEEGMVREGTGQKITDYYLLEDDAVDQDIAKIPFKAIQSRRRLIRPLLELTRNSLDPHTCELKSFYFGRIIEPLMNYLQKADDPDSKLKIFKNVLARQPHEYLPAFLSLLARQTQIPKQRSRSLQTNKAVDAIMEANTKDDTRLIMKLLLEPEIFQGEVGEIVKQISGKPEFDLREQKLIRKYLAKTEKQETEMDKKPD